MKKKLLSLALAGVMVAGLLTGCGNNNSNSGTGSGAGGASGSGNSSGGSTPQVVSEDAIANLIAATTGTVKLTVWASEEDQDFTLGRIEDFKKEYPDVNFDITLGAKSESKAKDDILVDVEAAPDVYAFADDQIIELVAAGALQEVAASYTYNVAEENVGGAVEAATIDGKLYAYPMTADNGYFMFYDASVFSEDDVKSMDAMIEAAKKANRKIAMNVSDGWYIYSLFKGAGYDLILKDDGSNDCTWNAAGATDVVQAVLDLFETGVFVDMTDEDQATAIAEGTICACVNGTWRAETAQEAWGENYAATKLPTFTVAGAQKQMSSFSGYKLIGVNPHSQFVGWSMILAEYLTNYDSQLARYEARGLGPANIEAAASDAVQSDPAIAALAAQAEFATPQRVGNNYWTAAQTLGQIIATGNPDGTDLQTLLDNAVEGITAPPQ
ncbi:MAG: extracellular solute-binding protein [Clostridium sp.]|nr:extracellular solute-binding protein [Acetatifactor muris]MCM1526729.1 extracellular solute-binding protein [Bacteroides sp.]MCM1562811.1 extracellular solute-binding protein [Clostridium sp.]